MGSTATAPCSFMKTVMCSQIALNDSLATRRTAVNVGQKNDLTKLE